MRQLLFVILFLLFNPGLAAAQENCRLYATLGRIHSNMTLAQENTGTALMLVSIKRLKSDLYFLDPRFVPSKLRGSINDADIEIVSKQLETAQRLVQAAQGGDDLLISQLNQPELHPLLIQATRIHAGLDCDVQTKTDVATDSINPNDQSDQSSALSDWNGLASIQNINVKAGIKYLIYAAVASLLSWGTNRFLKVWKAKKNRRAKRYALDHAILFSTGAINQTCRICDISRVGCRLYHQWATPPVIGTTMKIFISGQWIEGKVAWGKSDFCGVNFNQTLVQADLKKVLKGLHQKSGRPTEGAALKASQT